jgi:sialate O-acetylesterase
MLELPSIFSEGAILQGGIALKIWGRSDPGAEVLVDFLGARYRATADGSGGWEVELGPCAPGGPFVLGVSASVPGASRPPEVLRIEDIYVGEVWICSGQSNMQTPMERLRDDFPEEFALSPFPVIRQFALPCAFDFSGPREAVPEARWVQASAESLGDFSGVAWFFARSELERRPTPIGIVLAANGGAPIESFMSAEALSEFPAKVAEAAVLADTRFREDAERAAARAVGEWESRLLSDDRGLAGRWFWPEADASSWRPIRLPGRFDQEAELRGFCGALWLRRTFVAPRGFGSEGCRILLGTIADADRVFINGVEVGGTGYRYPPRKYPVPAGLVHEGENSVVLRVACNSGDGGVARGKPLLILNGPGAEGPASIDLRGAWSFEIGERMPPRPSELFTQWKPTALYNGMIAPLLRFAAAGVLWYQGESNTERPEEYGRMLESMILDWRRSSGRGDLPFLVAQLPIFNPPGPNEESSKWALLREAQADVARRVRRIGIAAALDSGEWNDIHPVDKKTVGRRLALAAEALLRGEPNGSPGPTLSSVERRGDSLELRFDLRGSGSGLVARGGEGAFVSVVDGEGASRRLPVMIEAPNWLSVDLSGIEGPALVLYAWADNPADRQLYCGELPAQPFRRAIPEA